MNCHRDLVVLLFEGNQKYPSNSIRPTKITVRCVDRELTSLATETVAVDYEQTYKQHAVYKTSLNATIQSKHM